MQNDDVQDQAVLDGLPLPAWKIGADGSTRSVNRRFRELVGATRESLLADGWESALHPGDLEGARAAWLTARPLGTEYRVRLRLRDSDGSDRLFDIRVAPTSMTESSTPWLAVASEVMGAAEEATLRALAESDQKFREIADSLDHVFWVLELAREGARYSYVSPAFARVWGRDAAELYADPDLWLKSVAEADRDRVRAAFEQWLTAPGPSRSFEMEYRVVRPDRSLRWVRNSGRARVAASGRVERVSGIAEDVTDRKLAQLALLDERDRLAKIASTTPVHLHSYRSRADGTGGFTFGADRLAPLFEIPVEELERDTSAIVRHIHPEDVDAVVAETERSRRELTPWRAEFRLVHSTRGEIWVEAHSVAVPEPDGGVTWHGAITDVTERKRSEQALAESQAEHSTVVENLREGVITCSLAGDIVNVNRAALEMYGFESRSECLRPLGDFRSQIELRSLDGAPLPFDQWPLNRVLRDEVIRNVELRVKLKKTGRERIFNYGGSIVRDRRGKPLLALIHTSDITDRKQAEEQLQRLNQELELRVARRTRELENSNRELEAFGYSVSHDLRAPLRAVSGFSRALSEDFGANLPEEAQRYLNAIRSGAARMGRLIDDLLALSRLGRTPLTRSVVDVKQLVESCVKGLELDPNGERPLIVVGELPPCQGDQVLLEQVFLNLLSNALKYSRYRSPPRIDVGSLVTPEGEVVYFVRDNGAGFEMEYAHKLFGVFQRLHRDDQFEGTGVGLAIVKQIVTRHAGRVWAESATDRGATFFLTIGEPSEPTGSLAPLPVTIALENPEVPDSGNHPSAS
jgi:PAS domain S-box-containing protein